MLLYKYMYQHCNRGFYKNLRALVFGEKETINDVDGEKAGKPEDELSINALPHTAAPSKQ
jgi:hypothetical protein